MLLLLEDDGDRLARFEATWQRIAPNQPIKFWRDAHVMMREAGPWLRSATLISLDHDLEPLPGEPDPGDGVMVAKWLVEQTYTVPIIIHSSNSERVRWMMSEFDLANRRHWRAVPFSDDWIEEHWRQVALEALHLA